MLLKEELTLVARAKNGEQDAVALLWDDITPKLYGYLVKTTSDKQFAEDVLQDTWLKALSAIETFHPRGVRFSAWLFAIARNECRQRWRKNGREFSIDEEINICEQPAFADNLISKITLENALSQLPVEDRDILCLRYISELSFKEIAHILEISLVSARVKVHRALKKAHNLLTQNQSK